MAFESTAVHQRTIFLMCLVSFTGDAGTSRRSDYLRASCMLSAFQPGMHAWSLNTLYAHSNLFCWHECFVPNLPGMLATSLIQTSILSFVPSHHTKCVYGLYRVQSLLQGDTLPRCKPVTARSSEGWNESRALGAKVSLSPSCLGLLVHVHCSMAYNAQLATALSAT